MKPLMGFESEEVVVCVYDHACYGGCWRTEAGMKRS